MRVCVHPPVHQASLAEAALTVGHLAAHTAIRPPAVRATAHRVVGAAAIIPTTVQLLR